MMSTVNSGEKHCAIGSSLRPSVVCPPVNAYFDFNETRHQYASRSANCGKGFQGRRPKVKVKAKPNTLSGRTIPINLWPSVRCTSGGGMAWRRGSLV